MKALLTLVFLYIFSISIHAQSLKRMKKLLEKQDYEQLEEVLEKSDEKDSINSVANYVYSLLYLEKEYSDFNLDSAYTRVLQAVLDLENTEDRQKEKYKKTGMSSGVLDSLTRAIEADGFVRAQNLNTVEDFQYYMDFFQNAAEVNQATELRDELAFDEARKINSYEGYLDFLNTYPDARQVMEAKELYDIRLYQEKTANGKINSYKEFILEYPESPFRIEAEKQLFDRITATNKKSDYLNFFQNVDHKFYTRKALNFLYHSYPLDYEEWKNQIEVETVLMDSLDQANRLFGRFLIPFFEISKYGFIDQKGKISIPKSLEFLPMEYICNGLSQEIIKTSRNGKDILIGRNMEVIFEGSFDRVEDLGFGILELSGPMGNYLIHKGGEVIVQGLWQEARIFSGAILGVHLPEGWELRTIIGEKIPSLLPQEIQEFHELIFLRTQEGWAFGSTEMLITAPDDMEFKYSEIEWEEEHFLALEQELYYIFDKEGMKKSQKGYADAVVKYGRWFLSDKENEYLVLNNSFEDPFKSDEFMSNKNFVLARNSDSWTLLENRDSMNFNLSEPVFIGDQFLMASRNDSLMLYFHPDSMAFPLGEAFPELITNAGQELTAEPTELVLIVQGKSKKLINTTGHVIEGLNSYENLVLQGDEYLISTKRGKKGIVNFNGEEILSAEYNGIGNYNHSLLALLKKGKFGCFRYFPSVMILPEYDIAVEEFNTNHFKARKDGLFGLLDAEGKILLDFQFDEILPWSDSLVMIKNDFRWKIINYYNGEVFLEDIKDFKVLPKFEESIIKILTGTGYGIVSNKRGVIVPPVYSDLHYFYNTDVYTYFCEKHIEEAAFHVLIYVDDSGKIIKKQAFEEEDFQMIFCELD